MTNAGKYLKDGVDLCELIRNIADYKPKLETSDNVYAKMQEFFEQEAPPTLTEDERVILKNLRYEKGAYEYTKIGRTDLDSEGNCDLILIDSDDESVWWGEYGHLFQFIKERRRIRDSRTIERRVKQWQLKNW